MVEQGEKLLSTALSLAQRVRREIDTMPGLRVMGEREFVGPELAASFDPLKVVVDLFDLGISGYQAADWLRARKQVTVGLADHRRIVAMVTIADDDHTASVLVDALRELVRAAERMKRPPAVDLPRPDELELRTVMLPRDAFFGETEQVDVDRAVGRVAAEMISPYPPGAPALVPGEVITREVLDYLRSGLAAGMQLPDPTDAELESVRVVKDPA
jgi:arginine/lysine/ornithine decarboxylase